MEKFKNIQSGDILLYSESGFIGNVIKFFTKKNNNNSNNDNHYTHSEIAISNELSYEIRPTGIKVLKFSNIKKNVDYIDVWRIKEVKKINSFLDIAKVIFYNIKTYSIFNLFVFMFIKFCRKFKLKWFEGNKYMICSEYVADCLNYVGVRKKQNELGSLLSPNDITDYYDLAFVERINLK